MAEVLHLRQHFGVNLLAHSISKVTVNDGIKMRRNLSLLL